jgi:UPF0755 protein
VGTVRKIVGFFLIVMLGAAGWFAWALLIPIAPPRQTSVMLHPGYSTRRIAYELKNAGVIRSEEAFILWRYIRRRRSLKAGEYLFDKPANIIDIQKRLRRGDVYFHTVVVPEGFTMFDIARAVEAAGLGPAADFLKVAKSDTWMVSDIAPAALSLEGYLFPETYQFSRMQTVHDIAGEMVCQFRIVAHQIGLLSSKEETAETAKNNSPGPAKSPHLCGFITLEVRANDQPQIVVQTDLERTVIMASIVEKETAVAEERPLVASVYYNRLAKRVALDADPSIIYAELLAGSYSGALHHDDMHFNSPYNTYTHAGLPPGPIGNPGKSALEAAMHPAQSDYYYFVADAQGHHRFARTMEEHNKNVVAYRRAMRGQ